MNQLLKNHLLLLVLLVLAPCASAHEIDYSRIKNRTRKLFDYIPPDKIEWTYQAGKFTVGDLIRHLACIERYMYAENVRFSPSQYSGCGIEFANGYQNVLDFYDRLHQESLEIFYTLSNRFVKKNA